MEVEQNQLLDQNQELNPEEEIQKGIGGLIYVGFAENVFKIPPDKRSLNFQNQRQQEFEQKLKELNQSDDEDEVALPAQTQSSSEAAETETERNKIKTKSSKKKIGKRKENWTRKKQSEILHSVSQ